MRCPLVTCLSRPLAAVAVLVVCLALAAAAYLAWRGPAAVDPGSPTQTMRVSSTRPATVTSRTADRPTTPGRTDPVSGLPWIDESALPAQARRVLGQIDKGGPYDYAKDGTTFLNAEQLLPKRAGGFYREYTVVLPGSKDRGPVRIVVGGQGEMYFWTTDHYASFSRIRR